ncbi:hypothetical protein GCM10017786_65830 [Amycolatopsis deserti]|uniref:N-acetyltransferase domain-containing protein n=1 Tax=Amycolatopsis deserti TaxID=185696 RepID=A0ABQ3JIH3_9PSEU|nr:hypothetical protein GCM10017786_65830 [Amycolatopsis deserti]
MEPVEIDAGRCHLRQLRAGDLPALAAAGVTAPGRYAARRAREWARDESYSWVIAEPRSGALLGEVVLGHRRHDRGLDLSRGRPRRTGGRGRGGPVRGACPGAGGPAPVGGCGPVLLCRLTQFLASRGVLW